MADATGKMCFLSKLLREASAVGDKVLVGMMVEDCGSRRLAESAWESGV